MIVSGLWVNQFRNANFGFALHNQHYEIRDPQSVDPVAALPALYLSTHDTFSMTKTNIAMVGLGVMGQNLTLNIERNGYSVAVWDREPQVLQEFVGGMAGKRIVATPTPEALVTSLEQPRKIILLVKAGAPVDWTIDLIKPFLEPGDVLIDGGNSHFKDTERRQKELMKIGVFLIGSGISGGEQGALLGPSLMPGGDKKAYEQIRPIWEAIAAKVSDGPCVTYIGPGGAGHFVKMVHNGIEYGDMQLIAEAYDVLRKGLRMDADQMAEVFDHWNDGELESYLIEITSQILRVREPETDKPLVDLVRDQAGQKGTGRWTSELALELGVPISTIDAAITARNISALRNERLEAREKLKVRASESNTQSKVSTEKLRDALYASKICSYAQGMSLIKRGSDEFGWQIDLSEVARIWQAGCIIRAKLLGRIKEAYKRDAALKNLLLDAEFGTAIEKAHLNWRSAISTAIESGIPVPAMSASLAYLDMYRSAELPLNLTQAQRDFFGSHTYERVDKPELGFVHTEWDELLEAQQKEGLAISAGEAGDSIEPGVSEANPR